MTEQMTKEQAVAFHDSDIWKDMSHREIAEMQMAQKKLCVPFAVFHEAISKALGRDVYTHEFGLNWQGLYDELFDGKEPPSLQEIIEMIPEKKRVIVAV